MALSSSAWAALSAAKDRSAVGCAAEGVDVGNAADELLKKAGTVGFSAEGVDVGSAAELLLEIARMANSGGQRKGAVDIVVTFGGI